jgi:hypothetical protein
LFAGRVTSDRRQRKQFMPVTYHLSPVTFFSYALRRLLRYIGFTILADCFDQT